MKISKEETSKKWKILPCTEVLSHKLKDFLMRQIVNPQRTKGKMTVITSILWAIREMGHHKYFMSDEYHLRKGNSCANVWMSLTTLRISFRKVSKCLFHQKLSNFKGIIITYRCKPNYFPLDQFCRFFIFLYFVILRGNIHNFALLSC